MSKNFTILCPGLWTATYEFSSGVSRTTIIDLGSGVYGVYSPGNGLLLSAESILAGAKKIYLIAPNHFHNTGLREWNDKFPNAILVCAKGANTRIKKQTGLNLSSLSVMSDDLPSYLEVFPIYGTKIGETWLRYKSGEEYFWMVGDAFYNWKKLSNNKLISWFMKLNRMGPGLSSSRLFRMLGISNIDQYLGTVIPLLEEEGAHNLVPCHGIIDRQGNFNVRAVQFLEDLYL